MEKSKSLQSLGIANKNINKKLINKFKEIELNENIDSLEIKLKVAEDNNNNEQVELFNSDRLKKCTSSLALRLNHWNDLKNKKLEKIKKLKEENFIKACNFKPIIIGNNYNFNLSSTNKIVEHSESYSQYISKAKKYRQDKEKNDKRLKNIVGSGKVWKNIITVPKTFQFHENMNRKYKKNPNYLLSYSLSSSKYLTNTHSLKKFNNYNSEISIGQMVENNHRQGIQIKYSMTYGSAINYLHDILHKINI